MRGGGWGQGHSEQRIEEFVKIIKRIGEGGGGGDAVVGVREGVREDLNKELKFL